MYNLIKLQSKYLKLHDFITKQKKISRLAISLLKQFYLVESIGYLNETSVYFTFFVNKHFVALLLTLY